MAYVGAVRDEGDDSHLSATDRAQQRERLAEAREAFYTPEHCLGLWGYRLQRRAEEHAEDPSPATVQDLVTVDVPSPSAVTAKKPLLMMPLGGHATQGQFDFGF